MVRDERIVRVKRHGKREDWDLLLEDKNSDAPPPYSKIK